MYVSDGFGAVYEVEHVRDKLELLVDKGTFRSPQTPALTSDGTRLLVPDYSRGIGILDLMTKSVTLLQHPADLSLAGIDGMYLTGHSIIAIQNGTAPPRLLRLSLDSALTRVTEWKIIEANWPGLGAPTHGVVAGQEFYFIANSGWDRLNDSGALKPGQTFEFPAIRRMSVNATIAGQ